TAQERVAPPLLPALDALEQKSVAPVVHLQEGGHGRIEVGEDLARDRDEEVSARQAAEFLEAGAVHRFCSQERGRRNPARETGSRALPRAGSVYGGKAGWVNAGRTGSSSNRRGRRYLHRAGRACAAALWSASPARARV